MGLVRCIDFDHRPLRRRGGRLHLYQEPGQPVGDIQPSGQGGSPVNTLLQVDSADNIAIMMSMPTLDHSPNAAWTLVFLAWLLATASTLGALFLGEIMGYTPCLLCWYQRICMFPLVLVLAAGLFPFDPKVVRYALPLAIAGWLLAAFHLALVGGLIPESVQPCRQGVPCSDVQVIWFGFINIPLLSVLAFSFIIAMLFTAHFKGSK